MAFNQNCRSFHTVWKKDMIICKLTIQFSSDSRPQSLYMRVRLQSKVDMRYSYKEIEFTGVTSDDLLDHLFTSITLSDSTETNRHIYLL